VETPGVGGFVYPPQTLASVAACLREQAAQVTVLDAVAAGLGVEDTLTRLGGAGRQRQLAPAGPHVSPIDAEELDREEEGDAGLAPAPLVPAPPDAVGVLISAATLATDLGFVNALAALWERTPIFVFGAAARFVWRQALEESAADLVVLGEAEFSAPAAVEALASGRAEALATLGGVAYWESERIVQRPPSPFRGDLDRLPHPAWDLLPHDGYDFLTLSASRGCDHGCAYCPYVAAQGPFRPRSPAAVAVEARWLARTFGKPRLIFRDPAFAADREQAVGLCEALRKARVRLPWECESRPEHFDRDLLWRMRRAGCQTVKLGLETVDEMLLWGMNRLLPGWTAARYRAHTAELVATCRRLGLNCRVFVMTGLPGETPAALEATLAFLQALRPPAVSVKRYRPYPGTPMGEESDEVVGYPALPPERLLRYEQGMLATADPLPPRRRWLRRQRG